MPLSDDDRRRLEQIERALPEDDPDFAGRVGSDPARRRVRLIMAGVMFVAGMVVLVAGLVTTHAWITVGVIGAVLGAALMVGSALLWWRRWPS